MVQFLIEKGLCGLLFISISVIILLTYYVTFRFVQIFMNIVLNACSKKFALVWLNVGSLMHQMSHVMIATLLGCKIYQVKIKYYYGDESPHIKYRPNKYIRNTCKILVGIAPALICLPFFCLLSKLYVTALHVSDFAILKPSVVFGYKGILIQLLFIFFISGIAPTYSDFKGMVENFLGSVFTVMMWYLLFAVIVTLSFSLDSLLEIFKWMLIANIFHIEYIILALTIYFIATILYTRFKYKIPFKEMDLSTYFKETLTVIFNTALLCTFNLKEVKPEKSEELIIVND